MRQVARELRLDDAGMLARVVTKIQRPRRHCRRPARGLRTSGPRPTDRGGHCTAIGHRGSFGALDVALVNGTAAHGATPAPWWSRPCWQPASARVSMTIVSRGGRDFLSPVGQPDDRSWSCGSPGQIRALRTRRWKDDVLYSCCLAALTPSVRSRRGSHMAGEYNFRPVWPRLPEPVVFDPLLETNDSTSAFSR
jgi:hypothetical protein